MTRIEKKIRKAGIDPKYFNCNTNEVEIHVTDMNSGVYAFELNKCAWEKMGLFI